MCHCDIIIYYRYVQIIIGEFNELEIDAIIMRIQQAKNPYTNSLSNYLLRIRDNLTATELDRGQT